MTEQLTNMAPQAEAAYFESQLAEITGLGHFTVKCLYNINEDLDAGPDPYPHPWGFRVDLRCFVFENNYAARDNLQAAGVISDNDHQYTDCESASFGAYFDTKDVAKEFLKRFRKWRGERIAKMKGHIQGLYTLAVSMRTLDGSINADETTAMGLAQWILTQVEAGKLSPSARLWLRVGGKSDSADRAHTENDPDGGQLLVLEG